MSENPRSSSLSRRRSPPQASSSVVAIAQNPTDWKSAWSAPADKTLGVDFAGTVAAIKSGVEGLAIGDRVSGFVHGGMHPDRGYMAEYVVADAALVWHIPEGRSFDQASAMNCGYVCAFSSPTVPR